MTTTAAIPINRPYSTPEQFSVPRLLTLHLLPGALITAAFVALAPAVKAAGFPPIAV